MFYIESARRRLIQFIKDKETTPLSTRNIHMLQDTSFDVYLDKQYSSPNPLRKLPFIGRRLAIQDTRNKISDSLKMTDPTSRMKICEISEN